MSSSWTFLLLNVTKWRQNDVNPGICVYENLFTDSRFISVNFNGKNVHEDKNVGWQAI